MWISFFDSHLVLLCLDYTWFAHTLQSKSHHHRGQCPQEWDGWARLSLTHWGRDKMDAISQTTFSSAFYWMKMYEFRLRFHWILFPRVQLTIFHHWFRYWLGAGQATSHYLNQWWLVYWRIYASLGLNELTAVMPCVSTSLQWRHNERDGVSNHQPHDYLLNRSFKQIKENTKAPRHWPLCREITGDRWIPRTEGQRRGKCFHLMTSSW